MKNLPLFDNYENIQAPTPFLPNTSFPVVCQISIKCQFKIFPSRKKSKKLCFFSYSREDIKKHKSIKHSGAKTDIFKVFLPPFLNILSSIFYHFQQISFPININKNKNGMNRFSEESVKS